MRLIEGAKNREPQFPKFRHSAQYNNKLRSFPRSRRDEPNTFKVTWSKGEFSPLTRG